MTRSPHLRFPSTNACSTKSCRPIYSLLKRFLCLPLKKVFVQPARRSEGYRRQRRRRPRRRHDRQHRRKIQRRSYFFSRRRVLCRLPVRSASDARVAASVDAGRGASVQRSRRCDAKVRQSDAPVVASRQLTPLLLLLLCHRRHRRRRRRLPHSISSVENRAGHSCHASLLFTSASFVASIFFHFIHFEKFFSLLKFDAWQKICSFNFVLDAAMH